MAKSASKRTAKSTATHSSSKSTTVSEIPAPYSVPPPVLKPFLAELDPAHIYIVHVDNHPWMFKRRIFAVPVLMNVVVALLLLWRAAVALPSYGAIVLATLGHNNDAKVDFEHTDWATLSWIAVTRALMFFCDWALARFLFSWPREFFFGSPASPTSWRWKVGFRDQEVVVRKSRRWDQALPSNWLEEDTNGPVYQERILPAIDRAWVQAKTGYLMMDKNWDLDFQGMILAYALVSQGKASVSDFQKTVIVHSEAHGWLTWSIYKLDEGGHEENRKKIVEFKDRLTAMGKENLFFRWIELIQYETSQPGGFTPERQAQAMAKAKELFESRGVDLEELGREIGGIEALPGMELAR